LKSGREEKMEYVLHKSKAWRAFGVVMAGLCCWVSMEAMGVGPSLASEAGERPSRPKGERIRFGRLAAAGAGVWAGRLVGHRYFDTAWWKSPHPELGEKSDFHFLYDWRKTTYLHVDKGGHLYGGKVLAEMLVEMSRWVGFGRKGAVFVGGVGRWLLLLEIEMKDGYYKWWGFSVPDFAANTLGVAFVVARELWAPARRFDLKMSYHRSDLYKAGKFEHVISDYEGMTFWLTFAAGEMWPGLWPSLLNVAVGYGAKGLGGTATEGEHSRPEVYLALDYDIRKLPGTHRCWQWLKAMLNEVHFPAPAVRIYPRIMFYLLYF